MVVDTSPPYPHVTSSLVTIAIYSTRLLMLLKMSPVNKLYMYSPWLCAFSKQNDHYWLDIKKHVQGQDRGCFVGRFGPVLPTHRNSLFP